MRFLFCAARRDGYPSDDIDGKSEYLRNLLSSSNCDEITQL